MISALDIAKILLVVLTTLGAAIVVILLLYVIVSYVYFIKLIKRTKKQKVEDQFLSLTGKKALDFLEYIKPKVEAFNRLETEQIEVKTDDGITLRGDFYPAETQSNKTIICIHGYNSAPQFDFSAITPFLHKNDFNLLFANNRAHGKSDGKYIGFGVLDRLDTVKWIEAVNERVPYAEIILYGVSMGGATVMMASSLDLPTNVTAIIEDCGYTSVWEIFSYQIRQMFNFKPFPIVYLVESFCKLKAKYDFKKITPIASVTQSTLPILFIHGTNDLFVPTFMGEANYEACTSAKDKLFVEGAGHAQSYSTNPEVYEDKILDFLKRVSLKTINQPEKELEDYTEINN